MSDRKEIITVGGLCLFSIGLVPAVFAILSAWMAIMFTVEILIWGENCPGKWEATVGHNWGEVKSALHGFAWLTFVSITSFGVMFVLATIAGGFKQ